MNRPFLRGSLQVARIFGIPVYIHFTFLVLLGLLGFATAMSGASIAALGQALLFMLIMFSCILAHEFGHALMARRFGVETLDVTLLPIGGIARLRRMPEKPSEELLVALAGPAVNVVIAGVLFVVLSAMAGAPIEISRELLTGTLAEHVLGANIMLVLFNLLPAFPMDGGRVLRALLGMKLPFPQATAIAARVGQGMAVLFVLAVLSGKFPMLSGNPFLFLIAIFVWFGARAEAAQVLARATLEGLPVERMMLTDVRSLPASARLGDAVELLTHSAQRAIPISDDAGFHGLASSTAILEAAQKHGVFAPVELALQRDVLKFEASLALNDALQRMQESGQALAVVLKDGAFVGMLDVEHIVRALAVRKSVPTTPSESARTGRAIAREPDYIFPPLR